MSLGRLLSVERVLVLATKAWFSRSSRRNIDPYYVIWPEFRPRASAKRPLRTDVLCAQGHVGAVTGLMVGFGVADYTGIIERGHTQTQERRR